MRKCMYACMCQGKSYDDGVLRVIHIEGPKTATGRETCQIPYSDDIEKLVSYHQKANRVGRDFQIVDIFPLVEDGIIPKSRVIRI